MNWVQYVMIALIVLLLIAYPLLMSRRNKAENQKMIEQANSLKKGDEIITNAGIYGKILEVKQEGEAKKVVIETGSGNNKSFMTIDAYAIYSVLNKEPKETKEAVKSIKEDKKNKEIKKEDKVEPKKAEKNINEEKKEEKSGK